MTPFLISQILVGIAICLDLLSFQFKERKQIVICLCGSVILIAIHFILLEQWTASSLALVAILRFLTSIFTTSSKLKYLFCFACLVVTAFTFSGLVSILSFLGSVFGTLAAFSKDDRRLRELMVVGTIFWIIHNYVIGSPIAILMELLFISSNLVGYYRYYYKKAELL